MTSYGQDSRDGDMRIRFYEELAKIRANAAKNCAFLTDAHYRKLVNDVEKAKTAAKKEPRDYWLLNHYDVLSVENKNKLIYPIKHGGSGVRFYVTDSELFSVLHEAHLAIGHGGRDRMVKELSPKYKNITRRDVELFIRLCETCQKKHRGAISKSTIFSYFNSHCRIDFIDFQSHPDRDYKFALVYQDQHTKFVVLKPLTSKTPEEVAANLMDIFLLLGAPSTLLCDDVEFGNDVGVNLDGHWPSMKIAHGKVSNHTNQDIENMLYTWMQDADTDRWSEGLRFVQLMKNRVFHSGIKKTPYEALFGCNPRVGLTTSSLSHDVIKDIHTEEDLEKVIESLKMVEKEQEMEINVQCS